MVKTYVSVMVTIAMTKHHDQMQLREKRFIWVIIPHYNSSLKEVRTRTQTGQESGGLGEVLLIDCSSWLALSAFLQNPGPQNQG